MWCNDQPLGYVFADKKVFFMEGQHMSRVSNAPPSTPATSSVKIPHDKSAMRAYEKWCKRGRPQGTDVQDWMEAEAELRAEFARSQNTARR